MAGVIGRVAPWRQTAWDWRAAGNFIGGGSGTGLLSVAAIAAGPSYPIQALLGMALVGAGLLCVWAEIGRPWRALNVFRNTQTSWMTREAVLAPLLFAAGIGAVVSGDRLLARVVAALALAYLYCQARMLHAGRGIPAWRHGCVIPLLMITGCTEGAGWYVITQTLLDTRAMPGWLPWLLAGLLVARLLVYFVYRSTLARTGAPHNALAVLEDFGRRFAVLDVAAAALIVGTALVPAGGSAAIAVLLAGLLAVLAGGLLKFTIVVRAAFNQGFALPRLPDRGSGSIAQAVKPGW
jgi:phenylacetyl-CoA:acceptor oxidoreductase 26-kDa subunit